MTHKMTPKKAIADLEEQCSWLLDEGGAGYNNEGRLFPDHCKVIRLAIRISRAVASWKWDGDYGARDRVMAGLAEEWRGAFCQDDYALAEVDDVVIDTDDAHRLAAHLVTGITQDESRFTYFPPATIEEFVEYLWRRHDTIIGQALSESDLEPVYRERVKARIEEIRNTVSILEHMQR